MIEYIVLGYGLLINILSLIVFSLDKRKAKKNKRRIPESVLHMFELLGGVFFILFGMYAIRHKNRKLSYYWITYLILLVWIVLLFFVLRY